MGNIAFLPDTKFNYPAPKTVTNYFVPTLQMKQK